jgi:hypothetical protein
MVKILLHFIFWSIATLLMFYYDTISISYFDYRQFSFFSIILGTIINILIFYSNGIYLFPRMLAKKINSFFYTCIVVFILVILSLIEGYADFFFNKLNNAYWDNRTVKLSMEYFDLTFLLNACFLALSFGYGFGIRWYQNEKARQILTIDKIQTELLLLKSQINPHFLFNTLNNIFGLAIKTDNKQLTNSISKLANLMRYLTYETKEGKSELRKEIEHLNNYIELQKLRFLESDDITITTELEANNKGIKIEPMLFLPIVENAFKHGISLDEKSHLLFKLYTDKHSIYFNARNKKVSSKQDKSTSGIGLENLKRRLKLLYYKQHNLQILDDVEWYEINLTINYNEI